MIKSLRVGIAAVLILAVSRDMVFGKGTERAKNIHYTPEIASDAYWDTHDIAVVRVVDVGKNEAGKDVITYEPIEQIEGDVGSHARTEPLAYFWFTPAARHRKLPRETRS